jgi:hypothetical protein
MDKTEALAILNSKVEQGVIAVFAPNDSTGGQSCVFRKGDKYYYADKSFIPYTYYGDETMIFEYDFENQEVPEWDELYTDRTGKSLEACIEEFAGCKIAKKEYIDSTKKA